MNAWQIIKQFINDLWAALLAVLVLLVGIFLEIPEFTLNVTFILFLIFVSLQIIATQIQLSRLRKTHPNVVAEDVTMEKPFPIKEWGIDTDKIVERYYLVFRNTKPKGINIVDTDPVHAQVSFYDMDCQVKISHEKPFWRGSPAANKRPSDYKLILGASCKPEKLCLITRQQGMRPLYVFSDNSYNFSKGAFEPFRNELELTNNKYYICAQLNAGNLDIDPIWLLLTNRGENEEPTFDTIENPCKSEGQYRRIKQN